MVIVGDPLYVGDLDSDLHSLLNRDDRDKQDIVERALWEFFDDRQKSALEAKLQHKRQQKEAIRSEIESERESLRSVEEKIQSIQAQLETIEESSGGYDDALDELLDAMEAGDYQHVFPTHGAVEEIAAEHDPSHEGVHEDLKRRAAAQERDLTVAAFKQAQWATHEDELTLAADAWGDRDE